LQADACPEIAIKEARAAVDPRSSVEPVSAVVERASFLLLVLKVVLYENMSLKSVLKI